ncbi:MFS transporter [Serratia sp. D1N4]
MQRIFFLAIGMFALGLDAYVIAGILPEIGKSFGTSDAINAQTVTVFTLCYAIAAPVFATLLVKKPVKKVLIVALLVFSLANIASALSPSLNILLISRAFAGIGAGLFSPIAAAAAVALVAPERKGRALSLILGGMSTGTVIGVPLGLLLANHFGWQSTLWLVTIIGLVGLAGILAGFPDIAVSTPPSLKARLSVMTNKRVAATVGITFLTALASLGLYTFIAPMLAKMAAVTDVVPYLWAWGIGGMIGSFAIGHLIDWTQRPGWLLIAILFIMSIALFSIPAAVASGALLAFIPFLIWGATGWSSLAPQQHTLLELQPQHGAAVVALNSSSNYMGGAVGVILGGLLITVGIEPDALPYYAGVIGIVALLGQLALVLTRRKRVIGTE